MFNVGGGELIVIVLVALIVLGPDRLPGAIRSAGQWMGELRKISSGFQTDFRSALAEAEREAEETGKASSTDADTNASAPMAPIKAPPEAPRPLPPRYQSAASRAEPSTETPATETPATETTSTGDVEGPAAAATPPPADSADPAAESP